MKKYLLLYIISFSSLILLACTTSCSSNRYLHTSGVYIIDKVEKDNVCTFKGVKGKYIMLAPVKIGDTIRINIIKPMFK